MLLITIVSALAWAEAPSAPVEGPTVAEAVSLLEGCSEPGLCAFSCWDEAEKVVEPAPNGSLRLICYQDGQAHGPMVVWRESGRPEGVGFSRKGVPHGGFRSWHPNGQRATEGRWNNGKAIGELLLAPADVQQAAAVRTVEGERRALVQRL